MQRHPMRSYVLSDLGQRVASRQKRVETLAVTEVTGGGSFRLLEPAALWQSTRLQEWCTTSRQHRVRVRAQRRRAADQTQADGTHDRAC